MKPKLLIVDDESAIRFGFSRYLSKAGYDVYEASCLAEARDAIIFQRFDAILLDLNLPDGNGLDWIIELRKSQPDVALVIITGYGDIPVAVEAIRRGADNFLTKPVNMADLETFLRKSLELGNLRRKHFTFQRLSKKSEPYFGESEKIKKVVELAMLASKSDTPIVLLGETGTGKGFLARYIHENSQRHNSTYVELNCSSLRGELLASELFGHIKGAFTTAIQDKQGLIEVADGGTLFLDEISDMDIAVQAQFLKVIEEKQYRRLGEVKVRKSDFRLICASNRDLSEEMRQGRFRKDLFYRINVFPINIPPLRERTEDIPGLVYHLLGIIGYTKNNISEEVMKMLQEYPWPGNIRELKNVLERAVLLSGGEPLSIEHFPGLDFSVHEIETIKSDVIGNLQELEESQIKAALQKYDGDTLKASKALGISRSTLYRKLKKILKEEKE